MARQFREQLEEEVNLEQVRKAHEKTKTQGDSGAGTSAGSSGGTGPDAGSASAGATESSAGAGSAVGAGAASTAAAAGDTSVGSSHDAQHASAEHGTSAPEDNASASAAMYRGPDPADFRADTFSHAHPTNEYGANPYTTSGAAEDTPTPAELQPSSAVTEGQTPSEANVAAAQSQPESDAEGHAASGEAYAPRKPRDNTPGTDNHGN
jgi:hypothetical protein